jgi:hypothetical protein
VVPIRVGAPPVVVVRHDVVCVSVGAMTAWLLHDFVDSGNVNNSPPFEFPTFDVIVSLSLSLSLPLQ